ncbi:hypothetical protein HG531_012595 [Fusarium graminearum]|nr:hypothetical protein HG531_012595 [Fusarium graminearum]
MDIAGTAEETVLLVTMRDLGLDLDVKSPAAVVLDGAKFVVGATISQREVRDMALGLLVVANDLAVIAILAVLLGVLSRRLTTLDIDDNILILVVLDVLEVEDNAVILEIKGDLAQSLVRGTVSRVNTEIPGVSGLIVVLWENKGGRVRNPLVLAML